MSEEDDSQQNITLRHRKEKKELQSKIQFLKKSASKGDKKKRKEILDEVSKIEAELSKRHSDELNNVNNAKNVTKFPNDEKSDIEINRSENGSDEIHLKSEIVNHESKGFNSQDMRISKAQRRRDKKALKEKEKNAEIEAEENVYINGPRAQEIRAIKDILKKRNLMIYTIPSDGDCLYNAICHQMSVIGYNFSSLEDYSSECNISYKDQIKYLRNQTANYIEKNKETLIFYMTTESGDLMNDEEFEDYCNKIRNTSSWGGQLEIRAIANILKARIEVLQATGPPTVQECDNSEDIGPTLVITYHRRMFSLGEHYNSTVQYEEDEDDDNVDNINESI